MTISVSNCATAKDIAIYRWVDNNNVVHFSQNLPKGNDYKELSTISSYKALSKAQRKALAEEENSAKLIEQQEKQRDMVIAKNKEIFEKNCKAARLNIKMLSSLEAVYVNEEKNDGSIGNRPLTAKEKIAKLTLSKEQEKLYCGEQE
ncbi:DUF4124 domain-containing protein [Colwelliaceae bacterium MEBiC 14330]